MIFYTWLSSQWFVPFADSDFYRFEEAEQLCHLLIKKGSWWQQLREATFENAVKIHAHHDYWGIGP